ncbi:MAG: RICIN domain-containing protein [Chloroflexia bacterium]|nr:RICIN domain-containing protein [Chloroflexia bacterium]
MKKIITAISFLLTISTLFAQENDYFGSVIIPKNEYLVKAKGSDLYWSFTNKEGETVLVTPASNETSCKLMFIPAGNGYYFIKSLQKGHYLNADNLAENTSINTKSPQRTDNQKFKVINIDDNHYKFITVNNLSINCNSNNKEIQLKKDNGSDSQKFEIIEAATKKKLAGN